MLTLTIQLLNDLGLEMSMTLMAIQRVSFGHGKRWNSTFYQRGHDQVLPPDQK